ncbi:MAG: hypothetical protein K1X88_16165 [Nannocystaceae bacterium]|nr:hypothetical protein [Nannocystaceae bacterium]
MTYAGDAPAPEQILALTGHDGTARGLIVIDSTVRGPAFGGIRRCGYLDATAMRADALALAAAMRDKCAIAQLPAGGAKTVLWDRLAGEPWPQIYGELGRTIDGLGGRYVCGPDVGTGETELGFVRAQTRHCNPASNSAGAATAAGVLAAMRALWTALGHEGPRGRTVVVQGLGDVGLRVASALVQQGARVFGHDLALLACERARAAGVECVSAPLSIACDVLVPCARGGVLHDRNAQQVPCRGVCGSANNTLAGDAAAILHRRGVLVVPDIVSSAGAVIEGVWTVTRGEDEGVRAQVAAAIAGIEQTAALVLARAAAQGLPPSDVAAALARERLQPPRAAG